jgi:glycosyltransferase involved in cell wall biosynthesis
VTSLQQQRQGVIWIPAMVPRRTAIALYSHAAVFCCPSIYEPFGLINLEAMACETPVVASAVGGIPEVVVDGKMGYLVDPVLSMTPPYEPQDAQQFARNLAAAMNRLLADATLCHHMGQAGRRHVEQHFSWHAVTQRTLELYRRLCKTS